MRKAPLALFVYNRPKELLITLKYLKKNLLINETDIIVFSDGPKNTKEDVLNVNKVRRIIDTGQIKIKKKFFFKKNKGTKKNILEGVNYIFRYYKKVIVLEDDIITSKYFLSFMNNSLEFIKNKKKIWHIGAWNYPIKISKQDKNKIILNNQMHCWGWGTYKKNWKKINLNTNNLIKKFDDKTIEEFTLNNKLNTWSQLIRNHKGILKSWAIFWYASIYLNRASCLSPLISYTKNIGFGNKATNTKESLIQTNRLNNNKIVNFTIKPKINDFYLKKIDKFLIKNMKHENKKNKRKLNLIIGFFKKILCIK